MPEIRLTPTGHLRWESDVATVLYGVGSRLDSQPELLFLLRDVDAQELISTEMAIPGAVATGDRLNIDRLGDIFDIDLDAVGRECSPGAVHPFIVTVALTPDSVDLETNRPFGVEYVDRKL